MENAKKKKVVDIVCYALLTKFCLRNVIFFPFFNVGYNMTSSAFKDKKSSVLTYHRIIEAFKFSYAWRSLLGDPDFDSEIMVGGNNSVIQMPAL